MVKGSFCYFIVYSSDLHCSIRLKKFVFDAANFQMKIAGKNLS